MTETVEVEVRVQLAVDAGQDVLVERGRHPRCVVVGRQEDVGCLSKIGSEQHRAAAPQRATHCAEKRDRHVVLVVSDRAADEEHEQRAIARALGRRPQRLLVGAVERRDLDLTLFAREAGDAFVEGRRRHVRREIAAPALLRGQRPQQDLSLRRRPCAELEHVEGTAGDASRVAHDVAGVSVEDRLLGARQVVLRQLGDALEQRRAGRVVEQERGQRFLLGGQSAHDDVGDVGHGCLSDARAGEADARHLEARVGMPEVAVTGGDVTRRREARAAP